MNIATLLEMAADAFPDRAAISCDGRSLTYAELLAAARRGAAAIRAAQVRFVGHLAVASPAAAVALFGSAIAGVPYVPLNYRLTGDELAALIGRIAPCLLVADPDYASAVALPEGVRTIDRAAFLAAACDPAQPALDEAADETIAVQLFTSGTTGQPKAAILRHENLFSYIVGSVEFAAAEEESATLVSVPPYHIAGVSALLSSVYAGRRIVQLPNFDVAEWLRLCRAEHVTNAFLVPTMLSRIVDHLDAAGAAANVPALRSIAYGGGRMPLPVIERAMAHFPGVDFTNAYGLTETSSTICLLGPDDHREAAGSADPLIRRRLASVGRSLPAVEIAVRDEAGRSLGADEVGRILVRGPQVAGEYGGLGSLLDADGWFDTRDRGFVDAGGYLFLDGRADDVIVRGGENISPGEVEEVLLAHPAVSDAAVVGIPDNDWGEGVAAAIVVREGMVEAAVLQAWVRARLRSSRVPQQIRFVETLPYNEMGKLLRRVVRAEFAA
ncbi:class I adenylate-forming enzyme family protein [Flavisphingomonas formosensis]|uniref:class I adenylate-forming enzyme family protein n=1 Tax=Flavisphingomonas formosensis TaxID=861534 RepID=UPI0012F72691|nr:class I adenylate-forming enzyme family protein [Sphingomonas formosensis]